MINRFWKWLGIHVHDWTNWETQGTIVMGLEKRIVGHWQTRECKDCKMLEERKIW